MACQTQIIYVGQDIQVHQGGNEGPTMATASRSRLLVVRTFQEGRNKPSYHRPNCLISVIGSVNVRSKLESSRQCGSK